MGATKGPLVVGHRYGDWSYREGPRGVGLFHRPTRTWSALYQVAIDGGGIFRRVEAKLGPVKTDYLRLLVARWRRSR